MQQIINRWEIQLETFKIAEPQSFLLSHFIGAIRLKIARFLSGKAQEARSYSHAKTSNVPWRQSSHFWR